METTSFCGTPVGRIGITDDGRAVTRVFFSSQMEEGVESALARKTYDQLMEYFEGRRRAFTIPLDPKGTVFQRRVWKALGEIPYGETRSYKQIAEQIGHPKAYRAVGLANNRNPIAILIPCHRVIGSNGTLVGYAGGLSVKERLLQLEAGARMQGKDGKALRFEDEA